MLTYAAVSCCVFAWPTWANVTPTRSFQKVLSQPRVEHGVALRALVAAERDGVWIDGPSVRSTPEAGARFEQLQLPKLRCFWELPQSAYFVFCVGLLRRLSDGAPEWSVPGTRLPVCQSSLRSCFVCGCHVQHRVPWLADMLHPVQQLCRDSEQRAVSIYHRSSECRSKLPSPRAETRTLEWSTTFSGNSRPPRQRSTASIRALGRRRSPVPFSPCGYPLMAPPALT
jgi:hypothetical protein